MMKIDSLEDLRKAQAELAQRKAVTKREFSKKLQTVRQDTSGYVLKKVVLPLGLGVVAAIALKVFSDTQKNKAEKASTQRANQEVVREVKTKQSSIQWLNYFNIFLSFYKIFQQVAAKTSPGIENSSTSEKVEPDKEKVLSPRELVQNYRRQKVAQE